MRFWRLPDRVKSPLAREPWSIEAGTGAVPIDELVSPLRYDILVRQAFFAFINTHRAELDREPPRFEERARAEPYYAWYVRITARSPSPRGSAIQRRCGAATRTGSRAR